MPTAFSTRRFDHPVAVTGGAGFLGREVVRQLQRQGCPEIRVVDIQPFEIDGPPPRSAANRCIREFRLDIRHSDMRAAFEGAKTVLHLAACQYHTPLARSIYDLPFFEVNVAGTRRVLEVAERAGVERLVFVSTNMVYGLPRELPLTEEHPRAPFGPYGRSKLEAEQMLERAHGHKLATSVVRPGLIVGPGRVGVIARIFGWIVRGAPVYLFGRGDNRYEMMASEDVASLVLAAASGGDEHHVAYNCAAREVATMRDWVAAAIARTRSKSSIRPLPATPLKWSLATLERMRLSPLRRDQYLIADIDYFMDAGLARRALGWQPRWTGRAAILDTLRWFLSEQHPQAYASLIAELTAERLPELTVNQALAAAPAALGGSSR